MDRATRTVALKRSGYTAEIVSYFLREESNAVTRARWAKMNVEYDAEGNPISKNINADFLIAEQDATLLQGLKKLTRGNEIVTEITQEVINKLPDSDVKLLLDELNKAWLDPEDEVSKKKDR